MKFAKATEGMSHWWINSRGYREGKIFHHGKWRRVREQRVIMSRHLGRPLTTREVVHHRNGKRADNRVENLEIMTRADHNRHHLSPKFLAAGQRNMITGMEKRRQFGSWNRGNTKWFQLRCLVCGQSFARKKKHVTQSRKCGWRIVCSVRCRRALPRLTKGGK